MISAGEVTPPTEQGMPDLVPDLAPEIESLSDLLIANRDKERSR
jgi:hypothetical protein